MNKSLNIWTSTRKLLLVKKYTTSDELREYRENLSKHGMNINECKLLAVVDSKKQREALTDLSGVVFCSDQDVNIIGKLKNESAQNLLLEKYDTILVVGDLSKKMLKLVKKISTHFSVGINTNVDFLTINLSSSSATPSHLLNFAKQTLEKIK